MAGTIIEDLRTVADYQFGAGVGTALFPAEETPTIRRSTSGRPQQVLADAGRLVSYGVDGRFTLGIEGGRRIARALGTPRCRVAVGAESVPFVADGRNAFSRFVRQADPAIRPGDEVLVVLDAAERPVETGGDEPNGDVDTDPEGLLAVGRAELAAEAMADFETGMAVKVRAAIGTND
jgi:conserved protein with predicted RNA binding PUA domain